MSLFDTIKDTVVDIFNRGPDDWRGRLGESVLLTSPEGNELECKWRGSSREVKKKLAIYSFPKFTGNTVRDLDIESAYYSIPLYFDGKDCDVNSQAFTRVYAKENGTWMMTHPVYDFVELQLISYKDSTNLVDEGGYVVVETEWIEPVDEDTGLTFAEAAGLVNAGADELNLTAAEQFARDLDATTEAIRENIEYAVNGVQNLSDATIGPLKSATDSLSNLMLSVQNGIQDTLSATVLEPLSLAGQIQQLLQLPLLGANDIAARLDYYEDLAEGLRDNLPGAAQKKRKHYNDAVIGELALASVVVAQAKIAVTGINAAQSGRDLASGRISAAQVMSGLSPTVQTLPGTSTMVVTNANPIPTRASAVTAAQRLVDSLNDTLNALDTVQQNFETLDIDQQYFSGRDTYALLYKVIMYAVKFLLLSAFDLSVEKRITLDKPRCPIEIVVTEYGTLGDNDVMLDLFIQTNELTGDEIYLLPAGREVVIYA